MTCAWCHSEFSHKGIYSKKYGLRFCCRSHFASWKFFRENYSTPIFKWPWK